jgi:hypothetical protein
MDGWKVGGMTWQKHFPGSNPPVFQPSFLWLADSQVIKFHRCRFARLKYLQDQANSALP